MPEERLPWLTPSEMSADQLALYSQITKGPRQADSAAFEITDWRGRLLGPFNAMLFSPRVGEAVQELGSSLRYRSVLSDRVREISILQVASLRKSEFEWYAHTNVAREVGITPDEIEAIRVGTVPVTFSPSEALALSVVTSLVLSRDIDDELFIQIAAAYSLEELVEFVTLVGYYDLLALYLDVWRVSLPQGVSIDGPSVVAESSSKSG